MKSVNNLAFIYPNNQLSTFWFCVLHKNTKVYGRKICKLEKTIKLDMKFYSRFQLFIIKTQHLLKHHFKIFIYFLWVYTRYRKRIFVYVIIFKIQLINSNVNIPIGTL